MGVYRLPVTRRHTTGPRASRCSGGVSVENLQAGMLMCASRQLQCHHKRGWLQLHKKQIQGLCCMLFASGFNLHEDWGLHGIFKRWVVLLSVDVLQLRAAAGNELLLC